MSGSSPIIPTLIRKHWKFDHTKMSSYNQTLIGKHWKFEHARMSPYNLNGRKSLGQIMSGLATIIPILIEN